jgi:GT2 family glycosyltransferase
MQTPGVSVVIVSFNTAQKLRKCLMAIEARHEVIVVDNGSTDGSPDMVESEFPHVRCVRSPANLGFGVANNVGTDMATRELVLLLNSDCYAHPGAIERLATVFRDPSVIAAGGMLLNPDGTLQESVAGPLTLWAVFCEQTFLDSLIRRFAPARAYWRTRAYSESERPVRVYQVMGACLMMRPRARFDPRFFLYCEDTELCCRLSRLGTILYVPNAVFTHELGSSSAGNRWLSVARYNFGKELYFKIHRGSAASRACLALNRLGAVIRLAGWLLLTLISLGVWRKSRNQVRLFWNVLTCPVQGPRNS